MLNRRDAPPAGLDDYVTFTGGGIGGRGSCGEYEDAESGLFTGPPTLRVPGAWSEDGDAPGHGAVVVGEHDAICLLGFQPGPVDVYVETPADEWLGKTLTVPDDPDGQELAQWPRLGLPDDSKGVYQVFAVQGTVETLGSYTLSAAMQPTLALAENLADSSDWRHSSVPRGSALHLGVSGFPAHEKVQINIFYGRRRDGPSEYHSSFWLRTNAHGEAQTLLATTESDKAGCYAFRSLSAIDDAEPSELAVCLS